MTELTRNVTAKETMGLQILPIAVAALLLFVIWKSSGIILKFSPQDPSGAQESVYDALEQRAEGSSIYEQIVWFFFGGLGLYLHLINKDRAAATWARAWPLIFLLAVVSLSFLWSSVPDIAFRRIIKHLLLVAAVSGIVMGARSPSQLLRLAVVFTGTVMAINYLTVVAVPALAIDSKGALQGMFGHKNTAGQFVAVSVLLWFVAARWSRGAWTRAALLLGTLLWFLFLLGTNSRTSIITAAVSIAFIMPLRYGLRKPQAGVIIALGALFISLSTLFLLILNNVTLSDLIDLLEGEKTTLTGRTAVWTIAYNVFLDHPLLGTGYGSLWSLGGVPPAEEYSDYPLTGFMLGLTQAHSGYFDVLATLGLAGVTALLLFIISVTVRGARLLASATQDANGLALAELTYFFLFGALVYNLTQSAFLQDDIFWTSMILCYLCMCSTQSPVDVSKRRNNKQDFSVYNASRNYHRN